MENLNGEGDLHGGRARTQNTLKCGREDDGWWNSGAGDLTGKQLAW